jgi:N-acetylmuramoyl-L-alanine amidase
MNYMMVISRYEVVLTRSDDTFISLDRRASFANEQKPRLFVSIHFNSAPSTDAEGIEVFYYRNEENKPRMNKSKVLAQCILDKTIQNTKAKSRGVKHGNYAVIRETNMPAVLIEGGFLTCTSEMEKIKNASYLKSLAFGIAQGVQDYLAKDILLAER